MSFDSPKILIVEDEIIAAKDLELRLNLLGYTVCSIVSSGEEAILEVKHHKPDLVLMDIELSGTMDGIDAANQIKKDSVVPVILLTAYSDTEKIKKSQWVMPFGYIVKPFQNRNLDVTIKMALYIEELEVNRRASEQKLKETEQRYHDLIENIPNVVWETDRNGNSLYVSENVERVYGFTCQEIIEGGSYFWFGRIHPLDRGSVREQFDEIFLSKQPYNIEYRILTKSGKWIWLHDRAFPSINDKSETIARGICSEITERKELENTLKENEERYKGLFNSVLDGIIFADLEGNIIESNRIFNHQLGYSQEELRHQNIYGLLPPHVHHQVRVIFNHQLITRGYSDEFETEIIHKDQSLLLARISTWLAKNENGKAKGFYFILRNISHQNNIAQQHLRDIAILQMILDSSKVAILYCTILGVVKVINNEAASYFKSTPEQMKNKSIYDVFDHDISKQIKHRIRQVSKQREPLMIEEQFAFPMGLQTLYSSYQLIYNDRNRPEGILIIANNITRCKEVEDALQETLREKENLLMEVYHRVKNNFQMITGLLSLQAKMVSDSTTKNALNESIERIESISMVHRQLYESETLTMIDSSRFVSELVEKIQHFYYRPKVSLSLNVESMKLSVEKLIPLALIINELVLNAFKHAFPNNQPGEIWVELFRKGKHAHLLVRNNGVPFDHKINIENQNSMGFTLVQNLTKQISGKMEMSFKLETCFHLTFPITS